MHLYYRTTSVSDAADHICGFYTNYHSQRFVRGRLILRFEHEPSTELVAELNRDFSDIVLSGQITKVEPTPDEVEDGDELDKHRLKLHFNRKSFGRLRLMIDRINEAAEHA